MTGCTFSQFTLLNVSVNPIPYALIPVLFGEHLYLPCGYVRYYIVVEVWCDSFDDIRLTGNSGREIGCSESLTLIK